MAAGPLACWLDAKTNGRRDSFSIEQGHMMSPASPSLIIAHPERSGETLTAMWIGGSADPKLLHPHPHRDCRNSAVLGLPAGCGFIELVRSRTWGRWLLVSTDDRATVDYLTIRCTKRALKWMRCAN